MSAIDHKAEAVAMLTGANPHGSPTEALAHATLALVEQQRIANLIAHVDSRVSNGYGANGEFLEEIDRALAVTS